MVTEPDSETIGEASGGSKAIPAEWTVMVYMAGDNSLADDCVNALLGLKQAAPADNKIHIIAQFDPSNSRIETRRVVINLESKDNPDVPSLGTVLAPDKLSRLFKDRVKGLPSGTVKFTDDSREIRKPDAEEGSETNSALPRTLFDFISWSVENFKAHRYMLLLVGHGSGIQETFLLKDENPPGAMELQGLKQVLARAKEALRKADGKPLTFDIIGFDSCLMSMVEVCFELEEFMNVLVGAQGLTPGPGWPLEKIIEALKQKQGNMEAEDIAPVIVKEYANFYLEHAINSGLSVDLSALKASGSQLVVEKVKALGDAISARLNNEDVAFRKALILAHWEAQSYNGEQFVDLCDFCELLVKHYSEAPFPLEPHQVDDTTDIAQVCADVTTNIAQVCNQALVGVREITRVCNEVKDAISRMTLSSCFCGIDSQYSNGVSIYFPWSQIYVYYQNLAFAKKENADWFNFLETYVEKTRRLARGDEPGAEGRGPKRLSVIPTSRRQPPAGAGPTDYIHSMRNPPNKWSEHGIPPCIEQQLELGKLFSLME